MTKPADPHRRPAFANPDALPGFLAGEDGAALLAAAGDVALILSSKGAILDLAVSHGDLANHGLDDWIGGAWIETVTVESRPKVEEMLVEAAKPDARPRWRQVNHPAAGGDLPIRYIVMKIGDRLVAIGRDMRDAAAMQQRLLQTQQSLERDYIRLRQAETRYRLLFDMTAEAILIVDAETRRIREANPAAHRLLGAAAGALIGESVGTVVAADRRDDLIAHIGVAEGTGEVAPSPFALPGRRGDASISARLFRQARAPLLIVRIEPAERLAEPRPFDSALVEVVERMPDAFVLVDADLTVLVANAAFVDLTELPSVDGVVGVRLATWLGRPGIDLDLIVGQLREQGSVRNVATILRGAGGGREEIEVSGVVAPTDDGDCFGFTIRNVGRRLRRAPAEPAGMPRSVAQLTELVGRMTLKEIVRESTDMIERLCIEAALAYTSDNRASAAEILGVSRQSLYSKLHRHGLGNLVSSDN